MPLPDRATALTELNHRQEIAIERIEYAVSELATALLTYSGSNDATQSAIAQVRAAVGPAIAGILSREG
jgi:hypothetical protein